MLGVGLAGPVGGEGRVGPRRFARDEPPDHPTVGADRRGARCLGRPRGRARTGARRVRGPARALRQRAGHPARGVVGRRRRTPGHDRRRSSGRPRDARHPARGRRGDRRSSRSCRNDPGADPRGRAQGRDRRGSALPAPPGRHRDAAARAVRAGRSGRDERRRGSRHRRHAPGDRCGPRLRGEAGGEPRRGRGVGRVGPRGRHRWRSPRGRGPCQRHDRRGHRVGPCRAASAGAHPVGGLDRRRAVGRSSRSWPPTSLRAKARSRAGTGSSADSPTRPSSSKRPRGAAR